MGGVGVRFARCFEVWMHERLGTKRCVLTVLGTLDKGTRGVKTMPLTQVDFHAHFWV